jgi:hypothetical protein
VKALEYSRYDINEYHFWMAKLGASHTLATTTNNRVVTSSEDATGHVTDYCGILQNIVEYMFSDTKELSLLFFQCDWFDPINDTRLDDFIMVEVKHESCYSGSSLLLAHQAQLVYCLSYHHPSLKILCIVYKVNPKMHTCWYDEYMKRHKEDDIYQEEIEVHRNFMVSDGASLAELDIGDT